MTRWWSKPRLRSANEEAERKVGFLDLFYDLIFVVAVAQVAHGLAKHPDMNGVMEFALVFLPIAWLWMGNTFYTERFETDDVSHRLATFLQMLPVVGVAVFAHGALHDTAIPFIISYVAGRVMIIALWLRGAVHHPEIRPFVARLAFGFGIGAALWIASIWVEGPARPALWVAGIVVDILTPIFSRRLIGTSPAHSRHRLTERFGLFTIIVLGESVAGTANGLAEQHGLTPTAMMTGGLAMAFAFALFWVYFEMVPREKLKPGFWAFQARSYLHIPMLAALTATGAGVLAMVGHEGELVDPGALRVLSWSLTVFMLSLIGLSRVHQYLSNFGDKARFRTETSLWLGVAASLAIGWFGTNLHPIQVIALLLAVVMILIFWGVLAWAMNRVQIE